MLERQRTSVYINNFTIKINNPLLNAYEPIDYFNNVKELFVYSNLLKSED